MLRSRFSRSTQCRHCAIEPIVKRCGVNALAVHIKAGATASAQVICWRSGWIAESVCGPRGRTAARNFATMSRSGFMPGNVAGWYRDISQVEYTFAGAPVLSVINRQLSRSKISTCCRRYSFRQSAYLIQLNRVKSEFIIVSL